MAYDRTFSLLNQSFTTPVLIVGGTTPVNYTITGAQIGMGVLVTGRSASVLIPQLYGYVAAANTVTVVLSALVSVAATTINIDIRVIP